MQRFNAEMNEVFAQQEAEQRDRLVESLKRYQLDLAKAMEDIVQNIGTRSLELQQQAYELIECQTQKYISIQNEAKKQSILELKEVRDEFKESDPEIYDDLRKSIMESQNKIITVANRFIEDLSEDIKRINDTSTLIVKAGFENINNTISSMASIPEYGNSKTVAFLPKAKNDEHLIETDYE